MYNKWTNITQWACFLLISSVTSTFLDKLQLTMESVHYESIMFCNTGLGQPKVLYSQLVGNATEKIQNLTLTLPVPGPQVMKLFFHLRIMYVSVDIWLIWKPSLEKLEFRLQPPLSYFDHLVSQVKITSDLGFLPHYRFRIGSNRIRCTIDVYIKALFGAKIFMYILYSTDIQSLRKPSFCLILDSCKD